MNLKINTNIPAMTALRNVGATNAELSTTINRLSTGLRINSAADDPAGLIISEGMRAQLRGVEQAIRNSQDAINMAKTAEGALEEVQRLLREIRGIAVHSANTATLDSTQLLANQEQIQSSINSINRIANQTQWGNKNLLNGTAGVLANLTDTTNIAGSYFGSTFGGLPIASGTITVNRTTAAAREQVVTNVTYTATEVLPAASFVINGYTFTTNGTEFLSDLMARVNHASANTGVSASIAAGALVLTSTEFGSNFGVNLFDPSGLVNSTPNPLPTTNGRDAVAQVTTMVRLPDGTIQASSAQTFTGGQGPGVNGLRLTDSAGNTITLTPTGNAVATLNSGIGVITAGSVQFQIGAQSNQNVTFALPDTRATNLGSTVFAGESIQTLDVTTLAGATQAIGIIDRAIADLSTMRGNLGSFQRNFLESTVRSLDVARENLTSTESTIRDADMAAEITNLTKLQILQQSGMNVLGQANRTPQSILQLLQG